jgi:N-6 DNA Methylase
MVERRNRDARRSEGGLTPSVGATAEQGSRLAAAFREAANQHPRDEASFRALAERALEEIAAERGVELDTRREVTLAYGRADAVFNRMIIEWEPPGSMSARRDHRHNRYAVGQLQSYVDGLANRERRELAALAGVACDGRFLIFARYRAGRWITDEPVPVDERSCEQLLDSLIAAQSGKALIAQNLLREFGPDTQLARQLSRALLDQLRTELGQNPEELPAQMYRQWETLFAVATGVVGEAAELKGDARTALARVFGIRTPELEPAQGLFALQTYFSIVTKLIALLALSLWVEGVELDLGEMAVGGDADLAEDMVDLQHGRPFRDAGLANVVEPDVFGWYLDWTDPVRDGLRLVVDRLKDYDPTTLQVSPEDTRDLLKDLYQGLLPRPLRHALGQYFTPDWLAELALDRAKYDGDPEIRLVDPACGTGTFLVLAIGRLKERLRQDGIADGEQLATVLRNVVGFDIDPLAAVAARTNYVLALGPLLRAAPEQPVDVPVYLADSVITPALGETLLSEGRLVLDTVAGPFALPACIDTGDELRAVSDLAAEGIGRGWPVQDYVERAAEVTGAGTADKIVLGNFYEACLKRHAAGLDGLWPHILRNAFMPAFIERFDLVVGNPPWVNWESLPTAYRERTRTLWEGSGMFVHGGMAAMLGAGKKDVAMLMSYVATDKLLKQRGRLAFVVTQTLFKTAGAGQGFRRFRVGASGTYIHVEQVDDLVDLKPFVGAANRTALVTWTRDHSTRYPVRYVLWQRTKAGGIHSSSTLDAVGERTRQLRLVATPVSERDRTSAWLTAPRELVSLRKLVEMAEPAYHAHAGVYSGLNGVYWLSIDGPPDRSDRVPVTNLNNVGRSQLPQRYGRVERRLIHPLVRGADIRRWCATPSCHILFVQDPKARRGIDEDRMRREYSGALAFLSGFEKELRARKGLRAVREGTVPYWSMFGVGDYTLAEHKVVWKDQAGEFAAGVMPSDEPLPLPNHKVIMVGCDSTDEAHYLCAVLNSLPVRLFVASYAVETQISTHTVEYIHVPRFAPKDSVHRALANASKAAHAAVVRGDQPDEDAVDRAAAQLWGLTEAELAAMRAFLDQLRKRDLVDA